jgi:NADH-quinone oxidoreductase subunit N
MNLSVFSAFSAFFPEVILAVSAMIALMYGVFIPEKKEGRAFKDVCLIGIVAFLSAILTLHCQIDSPNIFSKMLSVDVFTQSIKFIVLFAGIGFLVYARTTNPEGTRLKPEYPVLILLSILGMFVAVSARNLLLLYVGIELQALCFYILAAFRRDSLEACEAGLKYFILSALASGLMLFGMSLIYGFSGSLSYDMILARVNVGTDLTNLIGLKIGIVMLMMAFGFKLSSFPFHFWTPDVYEGSAPITTSFFASLPKIVAFAALAQFVFATVFPVFAVIQPIFLVFAIGSMVIGAFGGIGQTHIKRLIAYSTISNMGYVMIGFVVGTSASVAASFGYVVFYMIMNFAFFGILFQIQTKDGIISKLDDLAGLSKKNPVLAYALSVVLLSMAGIPPLAGFFTKFILFKAAIDSGAVFLSVVGLISSVVGCFYYLKPIKIMFFDAPAEEVNCVYLSKAGILVLSLCLFVIVALVIHPDFAYSIGQFLVSSLSFVNFVQ